MHTYESLVRTRFVRKYFAGGILVAILAMGMSSCVNIGNVLGSGGGSGSTGTTITVGFVGSSLPIAVASQIGTGSWSAGTPGNLLTVTLPTGTNNYGVAYVCPTVQGMGPINEENIIYATVQDGTSYGVSCPPTAPSTGTATGIVDASIIPGTASINVVGLDGAGTNVPGVSGPFTATMVSGTQDVAFIALDSSNNTLGVHIVPGQTVPGAINGGSTVVFLPADVVTLQTLTVTGVPSGFNATPATSASYVTVNGTSISLFSATAGQYPVVPSGESQTGDYYFFSANDADTATFQGNYASMTTTTAGAISLALPAPLTYSAPTPAALPTFNLAYSGFSGLADVADSANIQWFNPATTDNFITVTATAAFQNGATTLAIPDLTSVSGFLPSPSSGTTVYWRALVDGGTYLPFSVTQANGSLAFPFNSNTFVVP